MGTKRPFDEDLQEFIKHPKHLEYGNKPDMFGEDKPPIEIPQNAAIADEADAKFLNTGDGPHSENVNTVPDTVDRETETNAPLPLETAINSREENAGPGPLFLPNLFPDFFEFNMPRRQLVHYDDTYSSLLNCSPRKEVPIGPDHQADVPEFDPNSARNRDRSVGFCIISISNKEGEITNPQIDCKCVDSGSIRCVQHHISEARSNLKESLGLEKFAQLGFNEMGEEVAGDWTEEEEELFHDVVYSNPISNGKHFWEHLRIAFPARNKKQLVSYYFNVFILRRRAVQNRSKLLEIDSDSDEWWGSKRTPESSSEDGDENNRLFTSENEQEKASNGGLKSESDLHWDPPYSTMGSTKGVDLLPTCSMIEEIFGSSKTGENA